jgi:23S rRNA (cytidine2498-2'-O)-methyltransferase
MRTLTCYLAPEGYQQELFNELDRLTKIHEVLDRLILVQGPPVTSHWAQNIWLNPIEIPFQSIKEGTGELKGLQRNWSLYSTGFHRRAQLIAEGLPKVSAKAIPFPSVLPRQPMGSWTLLDQNRILAATQCSSLFPKGEIQFLENKKMPPSRAYLKLWEALYLSEKFPGVGSRCLDFGSCPGGWTWALHELGATVISVDKAPLDPEIASLPRVEYMKKDAFKLTPEQIGPVDWFFSDVICYPEKLYDFVLAWLNSGFCSKFVCTLKFQGKELRAADQKAIELFAAIPGSKIIHLMHNKHEVTWIKV